MQTLGERIKFVRRSNKLTQQEFSEKLRVSRPHISSVEHNRDRPSPPVIRLISLEFNVSEDWLLNG